GIPGLNFFLKPSESLGFVVLNNLLSYICRNLRDFIKPLTNRPDVKTRPSAEDDYTVRNKQLLEFLQRIRSVRRCIIIICHTERIDKMMRHGHEFLRRWFGGTDCHLAVKLPRVCGKNFRLELRSQAYCNSRLSDGRRACDN